MAGTAGLPGSGRLGNCMRLLSLHQVDTGSRLGETIFSPTGQPLLLRGVELSGEYIQKLHERGIPGLYVEDPDTADIPIPESISPEVRARAMGNLSRAFESVARDPGKLRQVYVDMAASDMGSKRFADAIRAGADGEGLYRMAQDIDGMLDQLQGCDVLAGLNSIKAHDSYTLQHSIDVTIMGMVLARLQKWDRVRLRAFGVGCILHDIGKIFIDPAILNKPAKLTADEFKLVQAHPTAGYELVRTLAPGLGVLAPHVAYQHHEKHDGSGYPRGLKGNPALGVNAPNHIHDFGAVCAVADVYDALTSDRPYRSGMPPDQAIAKIVEGSGTHFNRDAVEAFNAAVPPFPVCSNIRVSSGKYAGWQGIVAALRKQAIDRPKVRLLLNAKAERVDPVEVDLVVNADVKIESTGLCEAPKRHAA
jgi:HD-GYP domain-containing protein (c-di-GMP phosphodiesterase class II)